MLKTVLIQAFLRFFLLVVFFSFFAFDTLAQNESEVITDDTEEKTRTELHPEFEGGVVGGGAVSDGSFIYKSGASVRFGVNIKASKKVYYGISTGVEFFEDETFVPVSLNFTGFTKGKENSPYMSFKFGYATATNAKLYSYVNYDYRGGLFFSPGLGYKIAVKEKYGVMMGVSYKHQFANVRYKTADNKMYREQNNFHLMAFNLGFFF